MCVRRWSRSQGRWRLKKQRGLLLFLSPFACLLAANLIREEKYTFCFYKAGLCLQTESELSTILEIVSSLLKYFQTVTVELVSFPANCLASFPIKCLFHPSSENKGLCFSDWDYNADAGAVTINSSLIPDERNTCASLFTSLSLDLPHPLCEPSVIYFCSTVTSIFFKIGIAAEITKCVYVTDVKSS